MDADPLQATAARLTKREQHLRAILSTALDGITVMDDTGHIREANDAYCRMVGYAREELIGKHILEFDALETHAQVTARVARIVAQGGDRFETAHRHKSGRLVDLEINVSFLPERREFIAFARDISPRKQAERQILEIADREQARIGQELHDSLCQTLVSLAFDAHALTQQLQQAHRAEAGLAERITNHLDAAITEARQLARGLFPIRLEVDGLSSALEELARSTEARFGIRCEFSGSEPLKLKTKTIATHLYRIAQEAVTNALKHACASRIHICLQPRENQLELCVTDDGIGLPSDTARPSTGLGLYIMDYRARTIGGSLRMDRLDPSGTSVCCCLPLGSPQPESTLPEAGAAEKRLV